MVVVGLSGGVDSSVSALLLKLQGYKVVGIYMKNWHTCNPQDYADVVKISNLLDIPYYSINLIDDYRAKVFDSFIHDLNMGLTPNPDVLCNTHIKFDVFLKYAKLLGADYLATGHYAKIVNINGIIYLSQPKDKNKDQTYFLSGIDQKVLNSVLFPLSDLTKVQVRQIASDFNLPVFNKKDSMGICFISNDNYRDFIVDYIAASKGDFIDLDGNVLGQHDGLPFYTIGQKKGLGLDYSNIYLKRYSGRSLVVYRKSLDNNSITLVPIDYVGLSVKGLSFRNKIGNFNGTCFVRSSNLGDLKLAHVYDNILIFDTTQLKVAPGQYLVFYDDSGIVLGNAIVVD
jgi:tRNA-specific 2-thiouridylase